MKRLAESSRRALKASPSRRQSSALLLAVPFAFAGLGAAVVGWRPRAVVMLLGAVAVWSYFVQQFAALFDGPRWLERLSLFTLLGNPLSGTVDWPGVLAVGVIGTIAAVLSLAWRDVGR